MRRPKDDRTLSLFGSGTGASGCASVEWPASDRFPTNEGGNSVENWVWRDLKASRRPLVISGYSSLDRFLEFVATTTSDADVRLMFGNEPFTSRRQDFHLIEDELPAQIEKYWLGRGISLVRSAALIRTIERLKDGSVQARYMRGRHMLHAKIYRGDQAVTVGSSNFTEPGLVGQHEANARFEEVGLEGQRYQELSTIAENFWSMGKDYSGRLIVLLEKLLKPVHWDEALARACAELLEGEWAAPYLHGDYLDGTSHLWPSQRQGIAQALLVLDQQGSVLIADATGAGKTRMGTQLVGAIQSHIVKSGRLWHGKALMISPPAVLDIWAREILRTRVQLEVRSHGELSHSGSRSHSLRVEELKRAQVLCVDEGHNFLNVNAQRTQRLLVNMADHVIVLTATPINKEVTDLLRIADMLGADNLDPSTISAFSRMLRSRNLSRSLTEPEIEQLRTEIRKFTVRRTKSMLNALIDREPEAYKAANGSKCRFPRHHPQVYQLEESKSDRELARLIRARAADLHGVTYFVRPIEIPASLIHQGVAEERYLNGRLVSARKLAIFSIMKALRSSRAALLEHIHGTGRALEHFGLGLFFNKDHTGNQYERAQGVAGRVPKSKLRIELPEWLSDPETHRTACEHDAGVYEDIWSLAHQMSDQREVGKAALLANLYHRGESVLAFDSKPITLAVLKQMLRENGVDALLATGDVSSDRDKLLEAFSPDCCQPRALGLCSDSFSEGVNLQRASVLVHLDMPSVVRVAEQRAGRIDRLDSPHKDVHVWWPDDAVEFALRTDERLIERFDTVERLLGSNIPLPEHLQKQSEGMAVTAAQMVEEYEREAGRSWDGIDDAFAPVRDLIDGESALIAPEIYERYRLVTEKVLSRVSLISSAHPWAFFCLSAGSFNAPRWLLMPSFDEGVVSEFTEISARLRAWLPGADNLSFDEHAVGMMNRFLERLPTAEKGLLSRKKQRAVEQLIDISDYFLKCSAYEQRKDDVAFLENLLSLLKSPSKDQLPDWNEIASRWLDVIRPIWYDRLREKRSRPLLLDDIRTDVIANQESIMQGLRKHFGEIPAPHHPDERIRACIIGIP